MIKVKIASAVKLVLYRSKGSRNCELAGTMYGNICPDQESDDDGMSFAL